MSLTQSKTALTLMRYGVGLQLAGVLWGPMIPLSTFPRMALTAHIQCMSQGVMSLAVGLLLWQRDLLSLGDVPLSVVKWGLILGSVTIVSEAVNSFWGAAQILPLSMASTGSNGATRLQELIVTLAHIIPSPGVIAVFGTLLWHMPGAILKKSA